MKKILVVGMSRTVAGVGAVILNVVSNLDRTKYEPVVLLTYESESRRMLEDMNIRIEKVTPFGENRRKYRSEIEQIFAKEHYDYVWINNTSKVNIDIFKVAKKYGAVTIAHSHGESVEGPLYKRIAFRLIELFTTPVFYRNLDIAMACSKSSAQYFYSEKYRKTHRVYVMPNSIDVQKFMFRADARESVRKEFGWNGSDVGMIFVGRLTQVKNPMLLVEMMRDLPVQYKLLFVGSGELQEELEKKTREYGLDGKIRFAGSRRDVSRILSGADLFLLPSFHEGLPVSALEAQANGLPCIISDTITDECMLLPSCRKAACNQQSVWAEAVMKVSPQERILREEVPSEVKGADNAEYVAKFVKILEQYVK